MSTDDFKVYDLAVLEAINNTPFFDNSTASGEFLVEDLDIINNITTIYLDYNIPIPLTVYNENGFDITNIDAQNSFVEWCVTFDASP